MNQDQEAQIKKLEAGILDRKYTIILEYKSKCPSYIPPTAEQLFELHLTLLQDEFIKELQGKILRIMELSESPAVKLFFQCPSCAWNLHWYTHTTAKCHNASCDRFLLLQTPTGLVVEPAESATSEKSENQQ